MSYKAGIVKAISKLKDCTGSSSIAIKKHMKANIMPSGKWWINTAFLKALRGGDFVPVEDVHKLSAVFKEKAKSAKKPKKARKKKAAPKKCTQKKMAPKKKATTAKKATTKKAATKNTGTKKLMTTKATTKKTTTKKASTKKRAAKKAAA